jgi:hypothetical protein
MNPSTALQLDPEVLQFRVNDALRQRWIKPASCIAGYRGSRAEADEIAHAALDAMLTRPFRNCKFPANDDYAKQLRSVRRKVRRGKPLRVNVGYAPMKNLNAARVSRADWAEFFALCHLCEWHNKVQAIYPPGLNIKIVFDDAAVGMANRPDRSQMDSYIDSVGELISALGYDSFILGTGRHSSFAWLFHIMPFPVARAHLRIWEADTANRAIIEQMDKYARRNLVLPPGLSQAEEQRLCQKASHRYRVYWEALLIALWLQKVTFCANSLVAMYLDGSQHHIPLRGAFHLTTLGKGQITQPWQGEGALRDNGHGQLVPFVLTRERAGVTKKEVTGLGLLPIAGFDRIQVCGADAEPVAAAPTSALDEKNTPAKRPI